MSVEQSIHLQPIESTEARRSWRRNTSKITGSIAVMATLFAGCNILAKAQTSPDQKYTAALKTAIKTGHATFRANGSTYNIQEYDGQVALHSAMVRTTPTERLTSKGEDQNQSGIYNIGLTGGSAAHALSNPIIVTDANGGEGKWIGVPSANAWVREGAAGVAPLNPMELHAFDGHSGAQIIP